VLSKQKPGRIDIQPTATGWRAVVKVEEALAGAPGVFGASTEDGPWCEGRGKTPGSALRARLLAAGQAYICVVGNIAARRAG
jgi:hypothetical protein